MKRKYIAVILGMALAASSASAYAEETTETATEQATDSAESETETADAQEAGSESTTEMPQQDENQVKGEVTEVGEDSITVQKENEDETVTITVTSETTITKGGMGQPGGEGEGMGQPGGEGGEVPEKPDGESGEAPEKPDGESGEAPEKPDGESGEAPEKPDGESSEAPEKPDGEDGEAPEKPDGEDGEAPEKPDGESDTAAQEGEGGDDAGKPEGEGGEAPEKPEGEDGQAPDMSGETITLADITAGDQVTITLNEDGSAASITVMSDDMGGGQPGQGQPGGDQSQGVNSYTAVNTYEEDTSVSGETIDSTGTDENAVLVDADVSVNLSDMTITRTSSDSTGGNDASFYGLGAAVLATDGTTTISDSTITTDAAGGAGVFAYGDAVVNVINSVITAQQDTAGGIHAAGGGTLYAWDLTAETNGTSSAVVRSDRGGGTMVIDGGTYTSNGADSPAVYCTADITLHDAQLTSNAAEAVCIEGLNTLRLFDCDLSGDMGDDSRNNNTWTVILYQSTSGDAEVGNSTFEMVGGSLTSGNGGLFYTTNTESTITLSDVEISQTADSEFFLRCTGNENERGWGEVGRNGAACLFTGISQEMNGNVLWDSVSTLNFYMTEGSTLTGAIIDDETYAGEGSDGTCNVVIDESSKWVVTGDSTVTSLQNAGTITDADGETVSIVGTDGTIYVEGTGSYTITVGTYSEQADTSGASIADTWENYEVEQPTVEA